MVLFYSVFTVLLLIVAAGAILYHVRMKRMNDLPLNNPDTFLKNGQRMERKELVAVIGGDFVHGKISYDFVEDAANRKTCREYQFVNAGVNGNTAHDVLKRLDTVILSKPDYAFVLVGTNDAAPKIAPEMAKKKTKKRLEKNLPPILAYEKDLTQIVERLKAETTARIALFSLPIAGENLFSKANKEIDQYNEVIKKVAEMHNVSYLPFNEKLKAYLKSKNHTRGRSVPKNAKLYEKMIIQRFVYGHSFDRISRKNGFLLLTDGIHLNSNAGMIAAHQIELFLKKNQLKAIQ